MASIAPADKASIKGSGYLDTRWTAELHPLANEVCAEVDSYFLEHWPFPNEQARKKFTSSRLTRCACYFFPRALDDRIRLACHIFAWAFLIDDLHDHMSLSDGRAFDETLIHICRGDLVPERNSPIEWITRDLWENLRAHDRELADRMLEPCFVWMRSQTDTRRLKRMDLKEYFAYREADVGHAFTASIIRFCMALHLSPEQLSVTSSIEKNCARHITVINDIWSFEKEVLVSQKGHCEGGFLVSAVSILSDTATISTEASKRILGGLCREWEAIHDALVKNVLDVAQDKAMMEYLKALELKASGNEAWSKLTKRYSSPTI
ncbi:Aristolochene synthase in complex with 12,13-Difluorofarnesyl diphosphate [Nemania abortiva]|nr:Aristolochene synthase in complex with 12,13-Difluorofarnesyl diphosphate [Nemania abortiva]